MNTPVYSFRATDGVDYDGTLSQLEEWVRMGSIDLDDTVRDFLNGQPYKVREILAPKREMGNFQNPPTSVPTYAAYPRTQLPGSIPSELNGFNWGAFFLSWIWGLNHRKPILLICLVLFLASDSVYRHYSFIVFLVASIYAGANGNRWAWESGRFQSPEECRKCQNYWQIWSLAGLALYFSLIVYAIWVPHFYRTH